jgi:hypothetical protein
MHNRYFYWILFLPLTDNVAVFSAPKYCDSTENKGAYINISPDYKLDFHKFDAVPHPNIKPMVSPPTFAHPS